MLSGGGKTYRSVHKRVRNVRETVESNMFCVKKEMGRKIFTSLFYFLLIFGLGTGFALI